MPDVAILYDSVKMSADIKGSKPGADLYNHDDTDWLLVHLTRNKDKILNATHSLTHKDAAAVSAIKIGAEASVGGVAGDIENWQFRFIQAFSQPLFKAFYSGVTNDEGSMVVDFSADMPDWMLDSDPFVLSSPSLWPFTIDASDTIKRPTQFGPAELTEPATPGQRVPNPPEGGFSVQVLGQGITISTLPYWVLGASTNDHPHDDIPVRLRNFRTGKNNILTRVQKTIDVYTAFVCKDPSATEFQPLAWVHWSADWDVRVLWRDDRREFTNVGLYVEGDMTAQGETDTAKAEGTTAPSPDKPNASALVGSLVTSIAGGDDSSPGSIIRRPPRDNARIYNVLMAKIYDELKICQQLARAGKGQG